ncbi:MAG TPA: pyruvate, phosphate dikinase [Pseudonocardia sp.]|nr:pyruvate, phosphate dikinase [Pseudonocardia sp.]
MSHVADIDTDIAAGAGVDRALVGNKGAGLARMHELGLRVPSAFVITTAACGAYLREGVLPAGLLGEIDTALAGLEARRGLRLGDPEAPLLVSVRSGAPVSMPGMMDTVLDLGVTEATRAGLAERGGRRYALDSHRRFLESFGTVVLGIEQGEFDRAAAESGVAEAGDEERLAAEVAAFVRVIGAHAGTELLDDPRAQLRLAVEAVFRSWHSPRAAVYRRLRDIPDDLGTAVVVQAMVFGNLNARSGTGVVFTRDPNTGEARPYGDFLFTAQGEDVVAGRHRTLPVAALADRLPEVWDELRSALAGLERATGEMLDLEFTVEDGTLYVLQMRSGKRAAVAAVRIAVEMAGEGLIGRAEAVSRVSVEQLRRLGRPHLDPTGGHEVAATGLGASPGIASGRVCLSADAVSDLLDEGGGADGEGGVLLVRTETSPADIHGMAAADGILTSRGGLVSHAAVVARDLGVPAVVGVAELEVDESARVIRLGDRTVAEGELVTIDGASGEVVVGAARAVTPAPCAELATLLEWADELAGPAAGKRTSDVERLTAAHRALESAGLAGIGLPAGRGSDPTRPDSADSARGI